MNTTLKSSLVRGLAAMAILIGASVATTAVEAQEVPPVLPYQGFLTQGGGTPVDGTATIVFRLYRNANDVTPVWTETHSNVAVDSGVFAVYLGAVTDLVPYFTDGSTMFLSLDVNGDGEATPRQEIGSVPYALLSGNALNLGGEPADQFLTRTEILNLIQQNAGQPYILGKSTHTDDGRWEHGGVKGVAAANSACREAFANEPNAHMCIGNEVQLAAYNGYYDTNADIEGTTWTMGTRVENPGGARIDSSLGNNCQDLLYNTGDKAVGTTVRVFKTYTSVGNDAGNQGPAVEFTRGIGCGTTYAVLCCR